MLSFLFQIAPAPELWCWRAIPELAELHRQANLLIFAAYLPLGLELMLVFFLWRSGMRQNLSVTLFLLLFGLFIVMCGIGHYLSYYVIDHELFLGWQAFWAAGYWHLATGVVSMVVTISFTAVAIQIARSRSRRDLLRLFIKSLTIPEIDSPATKGGQVAAQRIRELSANLEAFNKNNDLV